MNKGADKMSLDEALGIAVSVLSRDALEIKHIQAARRLNALRARMRKAGEKQRAGAADRREKRAEWMRFREVCS